MAQLHQIIIEELANNDMRPIKDLNGCGQDDLVVIIADNSIFFHMRDLSPLKYLGSEIYKIMNLHKISNSSFEKIIVAIWNIFKNYAINKINQIEPNEQNDLANLTNSSSSFEYIRIECFLSVINIRIYSDFKMESRAIIFNLQTQNIELTVKEMIRKFCNFVIFCKF